MRAIAICLLIACGMTSASAASWNVNGPAYRPLDAWSFVGYKDKDQKDGTWKITAKSQAMHGEGFSLKIATYRAAELSKAAAHQYVQIIGQYALVQTGANILRGNETATIIARPADTAAPPPDCKTPAPERCFTASVDKVLQVLWPSLDRPAQ